MIRSKTPCLPIALLPILVLIALLFTNMLYFDDALGGANQTALIIAAIVCGVIGLFYGKRWKLMQSKILRTIQTAMQSILILFLIGALSGTWMLSGIIPTMIYYGIKLMHPSYILVASVLICSIVSLATGSSWSTIATIGIAIIGVGSAFGLSSGLVAGAVISGSYFGDKMSPLSDTTNLAPAVAGTDLFTHIRYMVITTGPAWILTLLIFSVIGLFQSTNATVIDTDSIRQSIVSQFNVSPFLFLIPVILIVIIVKKTAAIPAMITGTLLGVCAALIFQHNLLNQLIASGSFDNGYQILIQSIFGHMAYHTGVAHVDSLLSTGGMVGMLNTVFLIITALVFGGMMDACGCLKRITRTLISFIKNRVSLVAVTLLLGILLNLTACDQYLAIVIPGKMLQKLYKLKGYKPEVLSRALEDSATVTSPLIPWNSCGATQSKVLGVPVIDYLPYCFFNFLSPIVNIIITTCNYKIRRLQETPLTSLKKNTNDETSS